MYCNLHSGFFTSVCRQRKLGYSILASKNAEFLEERQNSLSLSLSLWRSKQPAVAGSPRVRLDTMTVFVSALLLRQANRGDGASTGGSACSKNTSLMKLCPAVHRPGTKRRRSQTEPRQTHAKCCCFFCAKLHLAMSRKKSVDRLSLPETTRRWN